MNIESMNSTKKGFTIVELAIVLVVIGVILGMAVKGKSLVDTARLRAEVNKVRKLEAAVHIYLATHPDMQVTERRPEFHGWGDFDMNYFYDNGILTQKDLESMAPKYDGTKGYWTPVRCQYYNDSLNIYRGNSQDIPFDPTNFCARIFSEVIDTNPSLSRMRWVQMPRRLQCAIEVFLDDEDVTTGVARYLHGYDSTNFTRAEYENCMPLPLEELVEYDMGVVLY